VVYHPESELVRKSFTVKKMDFPPSVQLTKRSMLRWFAISFGLLSEQESRDTVLNVLDSLFYFLLSKKQNPSTIELQTYISDKYGKKISEKLLRYHLNRLIASEFVQRKRNRYFLNNNPFSEPDNLVESFNYWVKKPVNESLDGIGLVLEKIVSNYKK